MITIALSRFISSTMRDPSSTQENGPQLNRNQYNLPTYDSIRPENGPQLNEFILGNTYTWHNSVPAWSSSNTNIQAYQYSSHQISYLKQ